ncbi:MAG: DNA polymerase [Planctomycetota bacterium]
MFTIDFETRSTVDLKKCGASVYARDPNTEVLCLAYGQWKEDVRLWKVGDEVPHYLFDAIQNGTEEIEAHNVGFERLIWHHICHKRWGWPDVPFDRWRCSMAACCRLTLPRSLDQAGQALGLSVQKDKAGAAVMRKLCKPRKPTKNDPSQWHEDPADFEKLYDYCIQDVRTEMAISEAIKPLTPTELKLWQIDQRINLRGLPVDLKALETCKALLEQQLQDTCDEIARVTDEEVKTPKQVKAISDFIESQIGTRPKDLSAGTVAEWLECDDLPDEVRDVLELRQKGSKASTAKITAMIQRCDDDGRVRGNLVYHGAATGRWAGSGIQCQNFPRGFGEFESNVVHQLLELQSLEALDLIMGEPASVISNSLRSMIKAPEGRRFLVCDFASIEARVLAWISGQDDLIAAFAQNADVYKGMASQIYESEESEITKAERQIGKIAILGLGYGMGWRSFITTCKAMAGVEITAEFSKRVVQTYRDSNDRIRAFWGEVNTAVLRTIETGKPHQVGPLNCDVRDGTLRIELPSGRCLHYQKPHTGKVVAPWSKGHTATLAAPIHAAETIEALGIELGDRKGDAWENCDLPPEVSGDLRSLGVGIRNAKKKEPKYIKEIRFWGVDSLSRKWSVQRTYGGKLVENITQAIARDFLAEAMFRTEAAGYETVATVHDEIIAEVDQDFGSLEEFSDLMRSVPCWGKGCPIEVDGYESQRYRK